LFGATALVATILATAITPRNKTRRPRLFSLMADDAMDHISDAKPSVGTQR
jgi:hypothetical protein